MTIYVPIIIKDNVAQPLPDGGSVGGILGAEQLVTEIITVDSTALSNKYVTLTYQPTNVVATLLFIYRGDFSSPKQKYGKEYTIVQTANNNNIFKRVLISSTAIPPDLDDSVPTLGMQDSLLVGDELEFTYSRQV